jgi:glycosyltransferase involved in cell wall biosynthesis
MYNVTADQDIQIQKFSMDNYPDQLRLPWLLMTCKAAFKLAEREFRLRFSRWTMRMHMKSWNLTLQKPVRQALKQNLPQMKYRPQAKSPAVCRQIREENELILRRDEAELCTYSRTGIVARTSPRYSIIIPVYRAEHNIHLLVHCLRQQTDPDFEAIFVNDCSPDNSAALLAKYAEIDSRIRVFHQPENMRQSAARNRGLREARGEYILFIDADDSVSHDYLQRMHEAVISCNADVAMCSPVYIYHNRREIHNIFAKIPKISKKILTRDDACLYAALHWGRGDFFYRVEPWGKIFRHSLLKHHNIHFMGKTSEDLVFSLTIAAVAAGTIAINDPLYFYDRRNGSDLSRNVEKYLLGVCEYHHLVYAAWKQYLPPEKFDIFFTLFHICNLAGTFFGFVRYDKDLKNRKYYIQCFKTTLNNLSSLRLSVSDYQLVSRELEAFKKEMERDADPAIFENYANYYKDAFFKCYVEEHPVYRTNGVVSHNLPPMYSLIMKLFCKDNHEDWR